MTATLESILEAPEPGHTYVIAEAGPNYRMGEPGRDLELCRTLISLAAGAGADAVKFQAYDPSRYYAPGGGTIDYMGRAGVRLAEVVADLALPVSFLPLLADMCREHGVDFLCSAFSPEDVAAVDPFVRAHKIASSENNHLRLLEAVAATGKPVLLSTGASGRDEIAWALDVLDRGGAGRVCLLQCTAGYPAPPSSVNLRAMQAMGGHFARPVGFSDHTSDHLAAPLAAVALGARVVEKHFTLDRRLPGPDHAMSITPEELGDLVARIRLVEQAMGSGAKQVGEAERPVRAIAKRALHTLRPVAAGETLREGVNFAVLRPGLRPAGMHPRFAPEVEGRRAAADLEAGQGIAPDDLA